MQQDMDGGGVQKAAGDEAFREGRYEEALARYSAALEEGAEPVPTLCNRSLTALKLGRPQEALQDAQAALQQLAHGGAPPAPGQLAKAVHRKAEALAAMGQLLEAVRAYRQGLTECPGSPEMHAGLRLAAEELPVSWLAKYWARQVEEAQAPNPLSSRDGRLIKPVPPELRLAPGELVGHLEEALYPLQDEARDLLCAAWAQGRRPGKAESAFLRAAAYLHAGNAQQVLKDSRFALVYGPQLEAAPAASAAAALLPIAATPGEAGSSAAAAAAHTAAAAVQQQPAWPAALALQSAALEALADNVPAALAMAKALELDPECEEYGEALERLLRRIPEPCAAALQAGGAAGLEAYLAGEREAAKPEFLRQRPKYYYYNEWMKKRIAAMYPELPAPVVGKLLGMEVNELDMILQYPKATQLTVERLLDVYQQEGGPERLESMSVPLLSWEDYKAIKEEGSAGVAALPAGDSGATGAGGRLLPGAGGEGGAVEAAAAEAAGGSAGSGVEPAADGSRAEQAGSDSIPVAVKEPPAANSGQRADSLGAAVEAPAAAAADDETASESGSIDVDELCQLD